MSSPAPSPRTQLKRAPQRGRYEIEAVRALLDSSFLCHVACVFDGHAISIPMVYARLGDHVLLHGSTANRLMRALRGGSEACVTVTHLDGLILARSAFHHSVNFRSVVIYGPAEEVRDEVEKHEALRQVVEHTIPGRWKAVRPPNREEFLRTMVLRIPIAEASLKLRDQGVLDDEDDYSLECWAGVLPLGLRAGEPVPDPRMNSDVAVPDHVRALARELGATLDR
jgi:nitroimidazol reductase NimA-like FMN-containing flavoprotein (pyridoxamine 5'-phosphate oxidase superfamily)